MTRISRAGTSSERGFTLIELSMVVLFLSIIVLLAFPKFSSLYQRERFSSGMRGLSKEVALLRDRAIRRRALQQLHADFKTGRLWVTRLSEGGDFEEDGSLKLPGGTLPEGFALHSIWTERLGKRSQGEAFIRFHPSGYVDRSILYLKDEEGAFHSFIINPFTGRARLERGYVEVERGE